MNTEPNKKESARYKPKLGVRLFYWLGIYFSAFLIVLLIPGISSGMSPHRLIGLFFMAFPIGLFSFIAYMFHVAPLSATNWVFIVFSLSFFLSHLVWSLVIKSNRFFYLQITLLIIVVTISLIGIAFVPGWETTRAGGFHRLPSH